MTSLRVMSENVCICKGTRIEHAVVRGVTYCRCGAPMDGPPLSAPTRRDDDND